MAALKLLLLFLVAAEAKHHYTGEVSLGFDDLDLEESVGEHTVLATEQSKQTDSSAVPTEKKEEAPARIYPMWETAVPSTTDATTAATTAETTTAAPETSKAEARSGGSGILPSPSQGGFPTGGGVFSFGGGGGGFGGGHAPVFPSDDVLVDEVGTEEISTVSPADEEKRQEERRKRREQRKNKKEMLMRERERLKTAEGEQEITKTTTSSTTTPTTTTEATATEIPTVNERREARRHRRLEEQRKKKEALRKERLRLRMEKERLLREEEDRLEEMRKQTLRQKQLVLKKQLEERADVHSGDVDEIKRQELEELAEERRREEEELKKMEEEARLLGAQLMEREREMETRDRARREEAERIRKEENERRKREEEEERRRRAEEERALEERLEAQRKLVEEERRQVEAATKVLEETRKKLEEETAEAEKEVKRQKEEELARLERKQARLARLGGEAGRMYSPEMYKEKLLREKKRLEKQLRSIEKHVGDNDNIEIEVEKLQKSRVHGIRTAQQDLPKTGDMEKHLEDGTEETKLDGKKQSIVRRRIITTSAAPITVEATTAPVVETIPSQKYATSPITEAIPVVEYQPTRPSFHPLAINPIPSAVVLPQLMIQPIQPSAQIQPEPVQSAPVQAVPTQPMPVQPAEPSPRSVEEYLKAYYDEYYKEWYRTHNQSPPADASSGFLGVIPAAVTPSPPAAPIPIADATVVSSTMSPRGMSKQQLDTICASIKSATKAFGIKKPGEYAKTHCDYIKTFYPQVTCQQIGWIVDYCAPVLND